MASDSNINQGVNTEELAAFAEHAAENPEDVQLGLSARSSYEGTCAHSLATIDSYVLGVLGGVFRERREFLGIDAMGDLAFGCHGSDHLEVLLPEFVVRVLLSVSLPHVVLGQFDRFGFVFRLNDESAIDGFRFTVEFVRFFHCRFSCLAARCVMDAQG